MIDLINEPGGFSNYGEMLFVYNEWWDAIYIIYLDIEFWMLMYL